MISLMQYILIKKRSNSEFREGTTGLTHVKEDVLVNQPQSEYLTHLTVQNGSAVAISFAILE